MRGIILDYGGTLDSQGEHWSWILQRGWRAAGIEAPVATFRDCYVHAERQLARERIIMPQDDFKTLLHKKAQIQLAHLRAIAPQIAVPADHKEAAMAIADYCDCHARKCLGRARPVLEALRPRLPMVLVSNFYGNIDTVLRHYGLRQYFQGIIESAAVGIRKPDPRIFMMGAIALGLEPQQVLVVGDSLTKDILPSESIGCRTAWLKGRGWTPDEDQATHPSQIPDLSALLSIT